MKDQLISSQEAASILGIVPETLRRWEESGKLGFRAERTTKGHRRYPLSKIEFYKDSKLNPAPQGFVKIPARVQIAPGIERHFFDDGTGESVVEVQIEDPASHKDISDTRLFAKLQSLKNHVPRKLFGLIPAYHSDNLAVITATSLPIKRYGPLDCAFAILAGKHEHSYFACHVEINAISARFRKFVSGVLQQDIGGLEWNLDQVEDALQEYSFIVELGFSEEDGVYIKQILGRGERIDAVEGAIYQKL